MGSNLIGPTITTAGLLCDIVGAVLVAVEVVKVFRGPTTIDIVGLEQLMAASFPKQILTLKNTRKGNAYL